MSISLNLKCKVKMFSCLSPVLIVLAIISKSCQLSTPSSLSYVAGVVEFKPPELKYRNDTSAPDYLRIIRSNEAADVDILVFPELTLNTVLSETIVPDPATRTAPCVNADYEEFLSSISCAARDTRKYIVVNVLEKETCTAETQLAKGDPRPCSPRALNQYNTNVVFDRNGIVIARYRKWNLFGENRNTTTKPEYSFFDTDFGVRFGQFICFDILFQTPAQELVSRGITDFIFPSMWFSELPFLTAAQIQSSWAYANDVNLLAAGANDATVGSTGTGIYAGKRGIVLSVMRSEAEQNLYVGIVPKKASNGLAKPFRPSYQLNSKALFLKRDNVEAYTTTEIVTGGATQHITHQLWSNGFRCSYEIQLSRIQTSSNKKKYQYRFAMYEGNRTYSGAAEGVFRTCAILACTNNTLQSCGTVFRENVEVENDFEFENITIKASFTDGRSMLVMPNSADFNLMPFDTRDFEFEDNKRGEVQFKLLRPTNNLLTVGIYANIYTKSDSENGGDSGCSFNVNVILLLMTILSTLLYRPWK